MKKSPITFLAFIVSYMAFLGSIHAATIQEWLFDQPPVGATFATVNQVPGGATPSQQENVTNTYLNLQVPGGKFPQSTGMLDLHLAKNSATGPGGITWSSLTQFTIELWVDPNGTAGTEDAINYNGQIIRLVYNGSTGYTMQSYLLGSSGYIGTTIGGNIVLKNTWSQIAMTWDGATLKSYVNGILNGSAAAVTTVTPGASSFTIGASGTGGQNQYYGYIDEMRVSNVALPSGTGTGVNELAWNASLVAVPEPGTTALLLGAGGLMAWVVRRKKR
ncbi:MAG: LamG-like jellyroll fold domain-containing protein [Chthoniobacterales bacterium]